MVVLKMTPSNSEANRTKITLKINRMLLMRPLKSLRPFFAKVNIENTWSCRRSNFIKKYFYQERKPVIFSGNLIAIQTESKKHSTWNASITFLRQKWPKVNSVASGPEYMITQGYKDYMYKLGSYKDKYRILRISIFANNFWTKKKYRNNRDGVVFSRGDASKNMHGHLERSKFFSDRASQARRDREMLPRDNIWLTAS